MQARFYAPWYSRFLSPDPARDQHFEETQSWNIYSYVRNNPVTHIDPNGMEDYPIADMPQMRVLSLTQSGIPAGRAEQMVAHEQQQRTVMGGTAAATLATGGLASTSAGVGMLARVGAGLGATWDNVKNLGHQARGAVGNLFSSATSATEKVVEKGGQGFNSFRELKNAIGSAGEGNHWHHIVEQSQTSKFGAQAIQNTKNIISIDASVHSKISGFYFSKQAFTNGLTVRQWLGSQSFEQQRQFGLDILKRFGVK